MHNNGLLQAVCDFEMSLIKKWEWSQTGEDTEQWFTAALERRRDFNKVSFFFLRFDGTSTLSMVAASKSRP